MTDPGESTWWSRLLTRVALLHPCVFITMIALHQGPAILVRRFGWWAFGEAFNSGCSMCDGKGHKMVLACYPDGREVYEDHPCGSCNSLHD